MPEGIEPGSDIDVEPAVPPPDISGGQWFRSGLATIDELFGRNVHLSVPEILELGRGDWVRGIILDDDAPVIARLHRKEIDRRFTLIPCNNQPWSPGECRLCKGSPGKLRATLTLWLLERNGARVEPPRRVLLLPGEATIEGGFSAIEWFADVARSRSLAGLHLKISQLGDPGFGYGGGDSYEVSARNPTCPRPAGVFPFPYERFLRPMSDDDQRAFLARLKASKHPKAER